MSWKIIMQIKYSTYKSQFFNNYTIKIQDRKL